MSELQTALTDPLPYEMITLPENEDFNLELFYDYWKFSDFSQHQFVYKLKELMIKYQLKSINTVQKVAKKTGYLAFKKLLECGACEKIFKIDQRRDIDFDKKYWFKDKLICEECRLKVVESQIRKYIAYFQTCLPEEKEVEISYPTQELTYLEKIFVYCLLCKVILNSDNTVKQFEWDSFNAVEANGVEFVLQAIIKKGYIVKIQSNDELLEKQNQLRQITWKYNQNLNNELKQEIDPYLRLNFNSEITLVLPEKHKTIDDWIESLYEEIIASKLSVKDCKDLEKFIINKRLKEVYGLLDYVSSYRKIPVKKNNALELDLIRMIKMFDLQHILSLLYYQGKMAASRLYDIEHSDDANARFQKDYVFGNRISSYLDYLEKKNEKPKYSRSLPENWTFSEIEMFVIKHIIGNYEKWDKFTPDEILALWVESVGMQNDEENI